jgi:glucose-6-phosphate 1-epimerase
MDNDSRIEALNREFGSSGIAQIVAGNGGLTKVKIKTQAVKAEIYLHGAQITSWQPDHADEVLFLSEKSHWQDGKAIRGGIPVCFPWFRAKSDDPKAPSHGFVRLRDWQLESISTAPEGAVCVSLSTHSDDLSRKWWPFEFRLDYSITVGKTLKLELTMANAGDSTLKFEEALHTYFNVGDVERVRVSGLQGVNFLDNRDGNREKRQEGELALVSQTDNAYSNATGPVEIVDPILKRRMKTEKKNSNSTIVWNPWSDGGATMADFGPSEWQRMLCVEGGNILNSAVSLDPGQKHSMTVSIEVFRATPD